MQTLSWSYIKEKWNNAGFQKYFQNMGWMFSARIFVLAVAFFVNAYMARYLGPSNYGLLNYVFSFVGLFAFMASLGIENIANREIINDHTNKSKIIGTSFYLKLFGSFVAILSIFITGTLTTKDPLLLSLIIMYSLSFIFSAFNIIEVYFQSQVLSKYPALVTIIAGIVSATLKIVAMSLGLGIIWLTAIYVLDSVIIAFGLIYFFINKGHHIKEWIFDKTTAILIIKDSWPLMLSGVAWSIYMKIDQIMIKNMIGNEQAGIYAVAAKLSEFWYFIPGTICASVFPAIVRAQKISKELYEERLSKLYSLMFYLALVVAVLTTIFASLIIFILFGHEYLSAAVALRIYIWAGIGVCLNSALIYYLISENQTKISAISSIFGAVINITLNFILIPKYGISGAAFASFISYILVSLSILSFKKGRSQITLIIRGIILPFNKSKK